MKWNHIMQLQPEHGRSIVQVDPSYFGYRSMGMRNYFQNCSFDELLKYCKDSDLKNPDFWWIYFEDFDCPDH